MLKGGNARLIPIKRRTKDVLGFRPQMQAYKEPELDVSAIIVMNSDNTFFVQTGIEVMRRYRILPDHKT